MTPLGAAASARVRLGDLPGAIVVTRRAARQYARAQGLGEEEARRQLTSLLLDARPVARTLHDTISLWRFRRRSVGLDVSARVATDGRLRLVVSVSVRPYPPRSRC